MFCTKCGIEVRETDKFCCACGSSTGHTTPVVERLSRPMDQAKIAGVCAGFARHFNVDVTVVRVLWIALTIWPLPLFGVVTYIVSWIVMPKDPVGVTQLRPVNGHST